MSDEADILAAERRRQEALVTVDLPALDALFADDLVHVHSTGLVHNKAELLAHVSAKRGFLGITRGALNIRVYGDVAVMTGPITNRMRAPSGDGETLMQAFVTQVLRRTQQGWRFVSFQLTLTA